MKKNTQKYKQTKIAQNSWGAVAKWYDEVVKSDNSYQTNVILPNIERLVKINNQSLLLDLACGQGVFCKYFEDKCDVIGIDISKELINIAITNCKKSKFYVSKAEDINNIDLPKFDKVITILALQNIKDISIVFKNVSEILKVGGKWHIVLNHPSFRQLKKSQWLLSDDKIVNARLLEGYMSSYTSEIIMNPSDRKSEKTLTYHRPLQEYIKLAKNNSFALTNLEEWISHKKQDTEALRNSCKEFPLFLYLELVKIK
jgi:ubiquinone/menaquinone biosynthesis C-methylase UbiE